MNTSAKSKKLHQNSLFTKIRAMANRHRFRIIEITQEQTPTITELSTQLKLSYTKCADYVTVLEQNGLVQKSKRGKETLVTSLVKLSKSSIEFKS